MIPDKLKFLFSVLFPIPFIVWSLLHILRKQTMPECSRYNTMNVVNLKSSKINQLAL